MKKVLQRGFTLIELLVVIAIIGILAAVVLASLNDARDGGSDASIKQTMGNIRSQAEIYYNSDSTFSYTDLCEDADVERLLDAAAAGGADADGAHADDAAASATSGVCNDSDSEWAAWMPLATSGGWCIDSTGYAGSASSTVISSGTDYTCS